MKSMRLIGLMLLFSLLASPAAAGSLGIFFDTGGTVDNMVFERGVPFNLHVIMYNMDDSAQGVEFTVDLPPEIVVLSHNYVDGSLAFPYLGQPAGAVAGVQVGLGPCRYMGQGLNEPFRVLTLTVYSPVDIVDGTVSLAGFPGPNGDVVPRYADCPDVVLHQMTTTGATLNVSVPAETPSWGSIKALFYE